MTGLLQLAMSLQFHNYDAESASSSFSCIFNNTSFLPGNLEICSTSGETKD